MGIDAIDGDEDIRAIKITNDLIKHECKQFKLIIYWLSLEEVQPNDVNTEKEMPKQSKVLNSKSLYE